MKTQTRVGLTMTHPLIERAIHGYRTAIEKQIERFINEAVGNIAVHDCTPSISVTLRLDDKNQSKLEQLTKPNYYALVANSLHGIFVCPVVAMRMNSDGTTCGWITLHPNEIAHLANASNNDTDGTLYDHFAELHKLHPLDRVSDDDVYDDKTNISIISLEHVKFTLATRLIPQHGTTYEYFALDGEYSTYRDYPYSYIIITSGELSGIYSTVDL